MQQSRLFLMSSGQSSSAATECTRPLLEAWCQMEDLWCFRDTMSRAQRQRARRCWRALAKWQFEKATISTWAQVEATSSPLRVLLVKRANVWYNKIVALVLRGPVYTYYVELEVPAVPAEQSVRVDRSGQAQANEEN